MILTIEEVRKEFSGYLADRVTEKKSLDAAFMHLATYCFNKGAASVLEGSLLTLESIADRELSLDKTQYGAGVDNGRILMARAIIRKIGLSKGKPWEE